MGHLGQPSPFTPTLAGGGAATDTYRNVAWSQVARDPRMAPAGSLGRSRYMGNIFQDNQQLWLVLGLAVGGFVLWNMLSDSPRRRRGGLFGLGNVFNLGARKRRKKGRRKPRSKKRCCVRWKKYGKVYRCAKYSSSRRRRRRKRA